MGNTNRAAHQFQKKTIQEMADMITATPTAKKGTDWTARFMALAEHISLWSKDPSTKVGAVIVDSKRRVVSLGYNGFPRGVSDGKDRYEHRPSKYKLIVHSEANAILNATHSISGCTMFTTKFPCTDCTKLIIQCGIAQVITPPPSGEPVWLEDAKVSTIMMLEADVSVHLLEP